MIIIRKISIALLFGICGCKGGDKDEIDFHSGMEAAIDKIKLNDLNGQSINLGKYKGKTVFLNFWATWCKPCMKEMPSIEKAQNILREDDVVFLLASAESAEEIDAFRSSHNYNFNYVRIENSEELNIQTLPV